MKNRLPVLALLAQAVAATFAWADADIGPAPGNALNPAPINPTTAGKWMDEEGLGTRVPSAHTPTGQHYNIPPDPGADAPSKGADWTKSGFIEFGGIGVRGDERSAWGSLRYMDVKSGAYVNAFGLAGAKPDAAQYFEATGGALGMDDQFFRVRFGRYNDWKVTAFYEGTPTVYTTAYRSLWNGVGTANLTLATLTPGGTANAATTQANIQNALTRTSDSELEMIRKKAGVRYDKTLGQQWKLYAAFTDEKRQGAQPFGAVFGGGGGGGNIEIPQSIDYDTYDFVAGAQYAGELTSFNLRASASFFRNDIGDMSVQNPLFITLNGSTGLSPTTFTHARFDLAPNNQHYNLKGEFSRALPDLWRGSFTATVAVGTMRQNDQLIAPTDLPLTGGTVTAGGVSLANQWNTTAALSRNSAEARIDTRLADFGLTVHPANGLDVRGKVRYYETHNDMQYLSCNPLTGQFGRILNEGSGLSLVTPSAFNAVGCDLAAARALNVVPATGNVPLGSIPYDYEQWNASVSADYRLGRSSSVNGALERETFKRDFRERDRTWEDKLKVGYVQRGLFEGTARLSYEHDKRGGSDYDTNPYASFYSLSLGPTPTANGTAVQSWFHTIGQFRSFDLADRNQDILNGRVDFAPHQNLDGAFSLQLKDARYPSELGRVGHQRSNSATLDLNYQAGSVAVVYGYYAHQWGEMEQKGVQPNSCVLGNTYYFYSDGRVQNAATGAAAPATPAGTSLVATQVVTATNWPDICGFAAPTSPLFPDSRGWDVASKDRNDTFGVGVKYDFGKVKLDTSYTRALGRTRIGYSYNAAALGMTATQAALAGEGLSDLAIAQNVFNASLFVPLPRNVTMRILVRHETGKIRDWHYDGVATNPMPANNAAYLDAGPQDYRNTLFGVMLQVRL